MTAPCPNCGSTRNPAGAMVCSACGKPIPTKSSALLSPATLTAAGGRKYSLSATSPTLIGSRGCAILLSSAGIEAQHARLIPSTGGYHIEPVMGAVLVDGFPISIATPLINGAIITLGGQALTYTGPSAVAPTATTPPSLLTLPPVKVITPPIPKVSAVKPPRSVPRLLRRKPPTLEGSVLVVDGPHPEGPDIDWAGLVLRSTFGLVLVPFLCWQPALVFPFLLYGLGQRNRQVPTRYLRVEDSSGKQFIVKMKGDSMRGMLSAGDKASFWGRWVAGNLTMYRAWNHNTSSDVLLKPTVQRRTNQWILGIVVGIVLLFWLVGAMSSY